MEGGRLKGKYEEGEPMLKTPYRWAETGTYGVIEPRGSPAITR